METPAKPVLDGVRIVDLGRHRAGATAGLLLAELGAEVVKVRLAQDAGRGLSPVLALLRDRSKAMLDLDLATDRSRLTELVGRADVVILDRTPAEMRELGLDQATLCPDRSDLIFATIGAWPASHPRCDRPVSDTLVLAEAGLFDEHAAYGRDGPGYFSFPLGSAHAAFLAAAGIVARLLHRRTSGRGGPVGTSLVQGAMLPMMLYWSRAQRPTASLTAGMPKQTPQPLYECADGAWMHVMGNPAKAPSVAAMLDAMSDEAIQGANARHAGGRAEVYPNVGALAAIFRRRPRDEWLQALWNAGVPVQPVLPTGALFSDEQATLNGNSIPVTRSGFGSTIEAAVPIGLAPPPRVVPDPPLPTWPPRQPSESKPARAGSPLAGLKVLDFGCYLAGPLAAMLLADLGADVIKVEAVTGEPLRAAEWAFNASQRGKRAIALDLAHPDAAPVLRRLVSNADVVHHNQRMPSAHKLGFDYASLRQMNPGLVYTHVSAYGPLGPRRDWPGYDQLFQAASGWEAESGGAGNPPSWLRFGMMDHLAALASLLGTLGALYARRPGGEGQVVTASLLAASLFTLETAQRPDGSLLPYPTVDSQQLGSSAADRLYRCADGWLALSAASVERVLSAGRCVTVKELEGKLVLIPLVQARAQFDAAGIDCVAAALANRDAFFDDAGNRAAGMIARYPHPVYGWYEQLGALWDFGDLQLALERAPPMLGQHTEPLLRELGFDAAAIDSLLARRVVVSGT